MRRQRDAVLDGIDYAERGIGRKILAPLNVRLACKRFINDLTAAEAGDGMWAFSYDRARASLQFCEGFSNIKGPYADLPVELMSWQR